MSDPIEPDVTPDVEQIEEIPEVEPVVEVDWKDKYEGQKKVNTDLERKFKAAADAAAKLEAAAVLATRPAEEQALEAARAEARGEATKAASVRIVKSELRLAAKGVLADPADALAFINVDDFEVNDDGDVDSDALTAAITELLERKPHLAAGKQNRFDGGADQGAKGKAAQLGQLSDSDLDTMSPADIDKARRAGRFDDLLGVN